MAKMKMNFGNKEMEVDDLVARMPKGGKAPSLNDIKPLPNPKPSDVKNLKPTLLKSSGTNEGTDQASANRNLPNDFANVMQDQQNKKGMENYEKGKKLGYKSGGKVSSASGRADGIAQKGKTKGKIIAMCGGGMYK